MKRLEFGQQVGSLASQPTCVLTREMGIPQPHPWKQEGRGQEGQKWITWAVCPLLDRLSDLTSGLRVSAWGLPTTASVSTCQQGEPGPGTVPSFRRTQNTWHAAQSPHHSPAPFKPWGPNPSPSSMPQLALGGVPSQGSWAAAAGAHRASVSSHSAVCRTETTSME